MEQRNIIDKLANFVARNGPKFEQLTKSKQKDNAKFSFLFGGDFHEYYKWKVNLEGTFFLLFFYSLLLGKEGNAENFCIVMIIMFISILYL